MSKSMFVFLFVFYICGFYIAYICVFILSKKQRNWLHKNLHDSGMIGRRKLSEPSLNRIFNALSTGVQYTLSFQWTIFGLVSLFECEFETCVLQYIKVFWVLICTKGKTRFVWYDREV